MKKIKKIFALLIAMVMVLGMSTNVFAAELPNGTEKADKTIKITTPEGLKENDSVTYTVYRVFAADANGTAISYKLLNGVTTAPTGFIVDDAGNVYLGTSSTTETNDTGEIEAMVGGVKTYIIPQTGELTPDQIAAIANYNDKEEVGIVTITGPSASKTVAVSDYGYFYITTTTGSIVTINSTNKYAEVIDKNSIPTLKKTITEASSYDDDGKNALAQVGTDVEFTVQIKVGKGATNYKFHDEMGDGLQFKGNDEVTVTGVEATQYTILETPEAGDDITITFADGIAADTAIKIIYKATVTSDALQDNPAENTATLDYGNNYTTTESKVSVYNAKFTVTKNDGNGTALQGAGFIIKNSNGKYYKYTAASETVPAKVEWVDNERDATEYLSDAQGAVTAFTGLANDTYTLIEKTVPAGYNKAADSTFTVAEHDYNGTNLKQESTVINNAGSVLPSTGGVGTTMFYVIGGALVLVAVVLFVTRKRMSVEK